MNLSETLSADFIDAQYRKWKSDPSSLSDDWQFFFKGFELAGMAGPGRIPTRSRPCARPGWVR
jgi:2-oxoglutarate dehydrogenase E1 component